MRGERASCVCVSRDEQMSIVDKVLASYAFHGRFVVVKLAVVWCLANTCKMKDTFFGHHGVFGELHNSLYNCFR